MATSTAPLSPATEPLTVEQPRGAVPALQRLLTDLLEAAAQAKQLHWNVVGVGFASVHLALDEVAAELTGQADDTAERLRALDAWPDGRTASVAAATTLREAAPAGVEVASAIAHVVDGLDRIVAAAEAAGPGLERTDPPSADLVQAIVLALQKRRWLLRAELG